jgi:hypothetical protein
MPKALHDRAMAWKLQVAIDCVNPDTLAAFWIEALGYRRVGPPPSGDWSQIVDPDGSGPPILFHRVPEPKVVKNRVHIDYRVRPPGSSDDEARPFIEAEVRRLVGIGATHVRTDDDESDYYAVMQDPEGNEFCVG